jgi:hypothetical protein
MIDPNAPLNSGKSSALGLLKTPCVEFLAMNPLPRLVCDSRIPPKSHVLGTNPDALMPLPAGQHRHVISLYTANHQRNWGSN